MCQVLAAISQGAHRFYDIFQATQKMEENIWMGDSTLQLRLDRMVESGMLKQENGAYLAAR